MTTAEERLKILRMIQEGKITAEEGIQLMDALEKDPTPPTPPGSSAGTGAGKGGRWMRVRITDTTTGKTRVDLRLPVNLVNAGMKMGARFSPGIEGMDMSQILQHVNTGETGQVVDVFDEDDGEHVEIFIE
jgi:hypothetical protein